SPGVLRMPGVRACPNPLRTGSGPTEDPIHHAGGGVAVVQRAELLHEGVVGGPASIGHLVDVQQGDDDLVGFGQQPTSRGLFEVEVETTQVVPVALPVVGEEEHGTARVREVEHHRRVIGDQNIGEQEQLHDLRVEGHVMDETLPHDRHTVDHTWVATHEQYVVVAELVVHAPQVQVQIELVLTTRVVLVVAPG